MCSITERKHLKEKKLALKFFSLRNWKDEFPCIVIQRLREKGFGGKTRSLFGDTLNLRCLLDVDVLISCSVMAHSLRPHGLQPSRLLCPWNSPGKNTGVGCHSLLQGIFLTQGSNPGLLHCRQIFYHLSHQGGLSPGKFL